MIPLRRGYAVTACTIIGLLALSGCGGDPLAGPGDETTGATDSPIVIGSQDYYSNEIIAETYAQALEAQGYEVDRQFRIGQREVYLPEIESGDIDIFPEYSGPLLQYWDSTTSARLRGEVDSALADAAPEGLTVLPSAPATDQDAYVVTREFADRWNLTSIGDLADVTEPLTMGGNSEGEDRPNGPKGLKSSYGIDTAFTPIEDGGGPLTVKALKDGSVQFAIIYTADPSIRKNDLVVLDDPEGLFLASHVTPIVSEAVDDNAVDVIEQVDADLTGKDLIEMNAKSVDDQAPASEIASAWLDDKGMA